MTDLNYQQGMRRMWSRRTRYDFYFPAFANLGEQAVLSKEIYCTGDAALNDARQALVDLEAKHSQLGLNRAGVESKFYSEGALGELNPTLKTVLDILKGISSVRGR